MEINGRIYNEEQKLEYLNCEGKNEISLVRYFIRLAPFEDMYGKDIADLSVEELKTVLIALNITSVASREHLVSLVRGYVNWAVQNGKTKNENNIANIRADDITSYYPVISKTLKNPEQVKHILNNLGDAYRFAENKLVRDSLIIWLLYMGIDLKELQLLKKCDIDYKNKIVYSPLNKHIKYEVVDEILPLWKKYSNIDYLEKVDNNRYSGGYARMDLVKNDYLFRPVVMKSVNSEKYTINRFCIDIKRIFTMYFMETGEYISVNPRNINISGIFYKIYLLENEGVKITKNTFAKLFNIEYKDSDDLSAKTRRYAIDYRNWKKMHYQ